MSWARMLWPDRIATRIAVTMLGAMLLTQLFGYLLFRGDHDGWWRLSDIDPIVERLREPAGAALKAKPAARPALLASQSSPRFQLAARPAFEPIAPIRSSPAFERLCDHLRRDLAPVVTEALIETLMPRTPPGPPPFTAAGNPNLPITLWLRLGDGSWLTATMPYGDIAPAPSLHLWWPWIGAFLTILFISLLAARGMSRSLRRLAGAAERLGLNIAAVPLKEQGPREIRLVTHAFNRMQDRLRRFVEDRTRVLAAISHDLRTPLSRLRLRTENLAESPERRKMLGDLDLMDRMIAATLSFARDDVAGEARMRVDLASLVHSLCDEAADAGARVSYEGPDFLPVEAAPTSLTRGIGNVIENAVKYGAGAAVRLGEAAGRIEIVVADAGPGIPVEEQERVFDAFYRIDKARAPDEPGGAMGGTGLGLAIARHVFRAHGGDVTLRNGETGGLVVHMSMPFMSMPIAAGR
ncbi:ATP-binding protein [Dongia sp.]|uniref:ATP-binding protein n=1 Tax=Dongia sp. TaxID=1977262 RepID=UPI0035B179A1